MKTAQDTQFALLQICGQRNCLNGGQVATDLEANRQLWQGCVFGRFEDSPAITLRDISGNHWNADTLLIEPKRHITGDPDDNADDPLHVTYDEMTCDQLFDLATSWCPTELEWLEDRDASNLIGSGGFGHRVLRVWWD